MEQSSITFADLLKKLNINSNEELETIKRAYEFAKKNHEGMKRLTGDDFITHPLEVTNILADLNVDNVTIVASLLHEVINNGNSSYEELKDNFGEEVAIIVECVSKINKLELTDENESSAIYLRKVLVGLAEDVRVLYIKLADRLHNMRTNWAINPDKQKAKAHETEAVLIPIAHRLGINSIKSELESLCLYYTKPDVYNDILEKLNKSKDELNANLENMKRDLSNLLNENDIDFEIKGRVKSVYSIYKKLSTGRKWSDIYDILALRIFVNSETDCYTVIGLIHSKYRPVPKRFKDYIANPKENMYQSLHTTVFGDSGDLYEIQVRTYEMDEIAEKGLASHWSYKEKGTKKVQAMMEQKLELFRNIIEANSEENDINFEANVKNDILNELIYVYTPKGDVVELPKGATPIDFAYRIHSRVGDTCVGALVNDNIVPLSYELQNNDIVKIRTNKESTPNKDWLNIAKTSQAKTKIKSYFSKKDREQYIEKGKNILERELRKRKLSFNIIEENTDKICSDLKFNDLDEVYLSIGSLRYTAGYIINLCNNDKHSINDVLLEKKNIKIPKSNNKGDIIVGDEDDILVNLAKCCNPVKGDEIIGYITKSDGISVHKKSCPNILGQERLITVSWNDQSTSTYNAVIDVITSNKNFLIDFVTETTKFSIQVVSINNKELLDEMKYKICVKIKNREELDKLISKIKMIKDTKVL